jgi:hypothetical protein
MRNLNVLKPQDVLILSKLIVCKSNPILQKDLSETLHISRAEISFGFERLKNANLISEDKKNVNQLASLEFLQHALKYLFPVEKGGIDRGYAIGPSFTFFKKKVVHGEELPFIWPDANGPEKGMTIFPFFKKLVRASNNDEKLFHFLNVIEIFRGVGGIRHQKEAIKELERILK